MKKYNQKRLTVSAVIPCYNDYIQLSQIISVIQKCTMIDEVIVVNDGSDQTCTNYLQKLAGIRLSRVIFSNEIC